MAPVTASSPDHSSYTRKTSESSRSCWRRVNNTIRVGRTKTEDKKQTPAETEDGKRSWNDDNTKNENNNRNGGSGKGGAGGRAPCLTRT